MHHQRAGKQVVQSLFAQGKPGHDKAYQENHAGNNLCKMPSGCTSKGNSATLEIGYLQSQRHFS
jgi:hypothetical protein